MEEYQDRNVIAFPSLFTLLNLFFGFLGIVKASQGAYHAAAWCIIVAIISDGLDGKVARWTGNVSDLGLELDSFADLVSAGVAPALLIYFSVLSESAVFGLAVVFLYLFTGAYRLTRFNIIQKGDRSHGYLGLPLPISGMILSALVLFRPFSGAYPVRTAVFIVVLSFLMVSTVKYDWPRLDFRTSLWTGLKSAAYLLITAAMAIFPQWLLFPVFMAFILFGLAHWLLAMLRGESTLYRFIMQMQHKEIKP